MENYQGSKEKLNFGSLFQSLLKFFLKEHLQKSVRNGNLVKMFAIVSLEWTIGKIGKEPHVRGN